MALHRIVPGPMPCSVRSPGLSKEQLRIARNEIYARGASKM
jgi:hypothetical protein